MPPCLHGYCLLLAMSNFKVAFINVNSLVSLTKRHYLKNYIKTRNPDVILIAEHKLRTYHKFSLEGFKSFIQHREGGGGGGTAVLIREKFISERISIKTGVVESCVVKMLKDNGTAVIFAATYCPPNVNFVVTDLQPLFDLSQNGEVLIGGDLNAKHPSWGGSETDVRGRAIASYLIDCPNFVIFSADCPTRPNDSGGSFIDVFLRTPGLPMVGGNRIVSTYDFESDHRAIEVTLCLGGFLTGETNLYRNFNKMNINRFRREINQCLADISLPADSNVSVEEIDRTVGNLEMIFKNAIEVSVPKQRSRHLALGNLPPRILGFIRERRRICRTLRRSNDPSRFSTLRADIRNMDRIIEDSIRIFEHERYQGLLEGIKIDNRTFGKVKAAAGLTYREPIGDLLDGNGGLIVTDTLKSEALADHLQNGLRPVNGPIDNDFQSSVNRAAEDMDDLGPMVTFCPTFTADGTSIDRPSNWEEAGFISPSGIQNALACRPAKKSCGLDKIPDIALKKAGNVIFGFLSILFNHCLNLGYFPKAWKRAMIVPIHKKGSPLNSCGSYRPISLLSAFGKLYESFILKRIRTIVEDKRILKNSQFGFRIGHSTSHALTVFASFVVKRLDQRHGTIAIGLDFAKAFDSVWHNGILYKMKQLGFDHQTCRLIASFLKDRIFRVKVGESLSNERTVLAGVPQGSLLGPILYNIFVSDMPEPPTGGLQLLYADDVILAMSGPRASTLTSRINTHLEELHRYFSMWGLKLNVGKCTAVVFKGKPKVVYPNFRSFKPVLTIAGETIPVCDKLKYLGVMFDEKLEFIRHVDFILERAKKIYFGYQGILRHSGGLSNQVKLLIYKQIIRPIISYAFPVWFLISSSQMDRLRKWERSILTYCLGLRTTCRSDGSVRSPSCRLTYDTANIERIDRFLVRCALNFLETTQNVPNELVIGSLQYQFDSSSLRTRKHLPPVALSKLRDEDFLFNNEGKLVFYHRRHNSMDINNTVYITTQ